jgi:hypothetical protein
MVDFPKGSLMSTHTATAQAHPNIAFAMLS